MPVVDRMRRLLGRRQSDPVEGVRARPPRPSRVGLPASSIRGLAPDGSPAEVSLATGSALVVFLTSSCYGCVRLWNDAVDRPPVPPTRSGRVVLVTPSPSTESARAVASLAPRGAEVVMSSDAWHAYQVTGAPWCVVVAGGVVRADQPAPETWVALMELLPDGS